MYIINKRYEKYIPKDFEYEKLGSRFNEVLNYLKSEDVPWEVDGATRKDKDNNLEKNEDFIIELITNLILADMLSLQKINNEEVISLIKYQASIFEYLNSGSRYNYKMFDGDLFSDLNFIIKNLTQLEFLSLSLRKSKERENLYLKKLGLNYEEKNLEYFNEMVGIEKDILLSNIENYKRYRVESAVSYIDIKEKRENDLKRGLGLDVLTDELLDKKSNFHLNYINYTIDKLEKFIQNSIFFAKVNSLPIELLCYVLLYNILGLHDGRTAFGVDQITNIEEYLFADQS